MRLKASKEKGYLGLGEVGLGWGMGWGMVGHGNWDGLGLQVIIQFMGLLSLADVESGYTS
eukprot:927972-Amorphochlora_amoeboformis.AAC.1